MKIHVTAVEVLREKERQGETQFDTKTYSFLSFIPPPFMLVYFFRRFFFHLTLCMTKLRLWGRVFLTLRITLLTQIGLIHVGVVMAIQWMVRWWVLVQFCPSVVVLSVDQRTWIASSIITEKVSYTAGTQLSVWYTHTHTHLH